jgi:murein tripeptide amidase MpaA
VVNPDGYEYSMNSERFWRKNRVPVTAECIGIDNNRNFAYEWRPHNDVRLGNLEFWVDLMCFCLLLALLHHLLWPGTNV